MSDIKKELSPIFVDVEMKDENLGMTNLNIEPIVVNEMVLESHLPSDTIQNQSSQLLLKLVDETQTDESACVECSTASKLDLTTHIGSNPNKIKQCKDTLAENYTSRGVDEKLENVPSLASTSKSSASEKDGREREHASASISITSESENNEDFGTTRVIRVRNLNIVVQRPNSRPSASISKLRASEKNGNEREHKTASINLTSDREKEEMLAAMGKIRVGNLLVCVGRPNSRSSASISKLSESEKDSKEVKRSKLSGILIEEDIKLAEKILSAHGSITSESEEDKNLASTILSDRRFSLQNIWVLANHLKTFREQANNMRYYPCELLSNDPLKNITNKWIKVFQCWDDLGRGLQNFMTDTSDLIHRANRKIPTTLCQIRNYVIDISDFIDSLSKTFHFFEKISVDQTLCATLDEYSFRDALCPGNYYIMPLINEMVGEYRALFTYFKYRERGEA